MINPITHCDVQKTISINANHFKSILCLDGDLPDASFFAHYSLPVIAADGAANSLMRLGIVPNIVIGDLDSIETAYLDTLAVLHKPDQNSCDYQKSLVYLKEQQLLPAIVCGINGGQLDHILNNINIFLQTDSILYAPPCIGYVLQAEESQSHTLPLGSKISLIGIPEACVSSQGLEWELDHYVMNFPGANSCFNRTNKSRVEWCVHTGKVLVFIHYLRLL